MEKVSVGKYLQKVKRGHPEKLFQTDRFSYIDIAAIDRESKSINLPSETLVSKAPSRARQLVRAGDVLVSTVRPNLNAVALVPEELDGAIASTGFAVLRPDGKNLLSSYLFHWVKTPFFVEKMVQQATGASYPAVTDDIVKNSLIPLPPLTEQRRIASQLDQADRLRRLHQAQLSAYDELARSLFLEMFGDPVKREKWPRVQIQELAANHKGSMRTGPFGSDLKHSEFVEEGIAVIGIDNAVQNKFAWGERRYITEEKYQKLKRYTVFPGDVVVTIMGTTGRSSVIPKDIPLAINTKHLAAITLDRSKANPDFISFSIHSDPMVVQQIDSRNKGAIMSGLNLGIIKELEISLPPLPLQTRFASMIENLERQKGQVQAAAREAEGLFQGLLQEVFGGGS